MVRVGEIKQEGFVEKHRENGVWADNSTEATRYDVYAADLLKQVNEGEKETYRILDVGASTGEPLYWLATALEEMGGVETELVSYDVDREALHYNKDGAHIDYRGDAADDACIQGAGQALPFHDESFDIVISNTLPSRLDGEHQAAILREIDRVLEPEGAAALEIDPRGTPRQKGGHQYVMTGEELSHISEASNGFTDYPLQPKQYGAETANVFESTEEALAYAGIPVE